MTLNLNNVVKYDDHYVNATVVSIQKWDEKDVVMTSEGQAILPENVSVKGIEIGDKVRAWGAFPGESVYGLEVKGEVIFYDPKRASYYQRSSLQRKNVLDENGNLQDPVEYEKKRQAEIEAKKTPLRGQRIILQELEKYSRERQQEVYDDWTNLPSFQRDWLIDFVQSDSSIYSFSLWFEVVKVSGVISNTFETEEEIRNFWKNYSEGNYQNLRKYLEVDEEYEERTVSKACGLSIQALK